MPALAQFYTSGHAVSARASVKARSARSIAPKTTSSKAIRPQPTSGSFLGSSHVLAAQRKVNRCSSSKPLTCDAGYKVALLGAGGGIGQPCAMLLSMNPLVSELALYDIAAVRGVAADLSHCNTPCEVKGFLGADELEAALTGAELVVIPAGVPRKPGMTRDDLFGINAGIVKTLVEGCAKHCPKAVINIISNPVNSTVPIAAEILKAAGVYDPKKLMGVTTLDVVRSNKFVSTAKGVPVEEVDVPVVGGHAGITILPLLSQATPAVSFGDEEREALTVRIQNAGTEVVEAKDGAGSATLSMAYAAARMAESCLKGLDNEPDIYECCFVDSSVTELPFFATKVKLGPGGVEKVMPIGDITPYEQEWLNKLKPDLQASIDKGIAFANNTVSA